MQKRPKCANNLLRPQQASGGACGDQVVIRDRRLVDVIALSLVTWNNHFKESRPIAGMRTPIQQPETGKGCGSPADRTYRSACREKFACFFDDRPLFGVVPCIRPRQQQHAGFTHSNIVNQAIRHHRQPAHRMNRIFGITNCFEG